MASTGRRPTRVGQPILVAVDPPITLGRFIKLAGIASTGGSAKQLVTSGAVRVNGEIEIRRGRKLTPGDVVETGGVAMQVRGRPASGSVATRD